MTVPYVIDHMGDFVVEAGTGAEDWQLMLSLVRDDAGHRRRLFALRETADYALAWGTRELIADRRYAGPATIF